MNVPSAELALPMLGMMILTLLVWVFMFTRRISYAQSNKIDIEDFKTPADVQALIPGAESAPGNNLKNLLYFFTLYAFTSS
jgi:hypothetical protein